MYSPKIDAELVKRLYKLKEVKKIPLTEIVNEAVREYLLKASQVPQGKEIR